MFRNTILPHIILICRSTLVLIVLVLTISECQAAQPYQPVQVDPVLESWRWRAYPELKGLGLLCLDQA